MRKSIVLMLLVSALPLAVSGCQKTVGVAEGAGFEMLTPSAGTRQFIVANDIEFARQVVAHNETCRDLPACRQ